MYPNFAVFQRGRMAMSCQEGSWRDKSKSFGETRPFCQDIRGVSPSYGQFKYV